MLSDKIDEFLGLLYHTIYHFYSLQYESEKEFEGV